MSDGQERDEQATAVQLAQGREIEIYTPAICLGNEACRIQRTVLRERPGHGSDG